MTDRQLAYSTLYQVIQNGAYSNLALKKTSNFATAIFYGVLERKLTLDYILNKYIKKPKLDIEVRIILWMGLYQIIYMDKVPLQVTVNETVNLVNFAKKSSAKGFVNGVLRSYLRDKAEIPQNDLSIKYSCNKEIVDLLTCQYGVEDTALILEHSLKIPPIYARVNTLKTSTEELLKKIDGKETIKNCIAIDNIKEIDKMKEYKQGYFHIQDISSQLCIQMLNPKPNDTIIDMCSAPGSKAFTMAEYMQNQGKILAFDIHPHKIELIKQGAKRLGIDIIDALVQDGTLAQNIPLVDKVLCDVPCSGLGIIGRKPEIKYKDLSKELPQVQYKILCNGANYTKDILVYSTCTINKLENEDVVNLFLSNHPEFKLEQMITRIPHKDNCDGFFTAVMSKGGNRC